MAPNQQRSGSEVEEFFDLSLDLACIVGFDGRFKRVNAAFLNTLGYSEEDLFSLSALDITHPDDVQPSAEALGRLAEGHDIVGFQSRVICADGSVRWLEWNTRTMPGRGLVYGIARDATDRRRAEQEQAALRRVATLIANETPPEEVFAAVAREVGEVLAVDAAHLGRYDADGTVVSVAQWGHHGVPLGARYRLEGESVSARVLHTGLPARVDGYEGPGAIPAAVREIGIRHSIGVPISVQGRPWGVMIVSSHGIEPFPAEIEGRLEGFTKLVATAISNASARAEIRALADEQAALRRVATLVARQTEHAQVFAAIAEEIGRLLAIDSIKMVRYEEERAAAIVASAGPMAGVLPVGTSVPLEGNNIVSRVFHSGRTARLDDYAQTASGAVAERLGEAGVRSVVGTPITVEGQLWGAILAVTREASLPPDTEWRISQFTELMATAIANAEARAEVARLAQEQSALRRVATLVAEGASPGAVFDAVAREVAALLDASEVALGRRDDDMLTIVAFRGSSQHVRVGQQFALGGRNVTATVLETGRTARLDDFSDATGAIGDLARRTGTRATVGAPIVVDGRTWGVLAVTWNHRRPPPEADERMARFAELLDTAIVNADSRDQLNASRARVLAAGDEARRRVVRDLHDGAQQRLVHTIITLKLAQRALGEDPDDAAARLAEALTNAERATAELRELTHGILPSLLTNRGLNAAVDAFVGRVDLPVELDVSSVRLPAVIEASAYFIVAEALTNVVKHACARRAVVTATVEDDALALEVRDDGIGGADPDGHGLVGIADRVAALGGRLRVDSPEGRGTTLGARLPLSTGRPRESEGP